GRSAQLGAGASHTKVVSVGALEAVERASDEEGSEFLKAYYRPGEYTAGDFEALGAAPAAQNEFTAAHRYSVSTLSVNVPAQAGIAILGDGASDFNGLLQQIPNVALNSLSEDEFDEHLGRDSAALRLWDLLRRNRSEDSRWGLGPTKTS